EVEDQAMTLILLNTTVKTSLIVVAALAATTLLRHRSAAVRHFVIAVALACAAATPLVRFVAPAWQSASTLQVIDRPLAVFDASSPPTPSSVAHARAGASISRAAVVRAIGIIWMSGVALSLAVLAIGLLRLRVIESRSRRIVDGPWVEAAADL